MRAHSSSGSRKAGSRKREFSSDPQSTGCPLSTDTCTTIARDDIILHVYIIRAWGQHLAVQLSRMHNLTIGEIRFIRNTVPAGVLPFIDMPIPMQHGLKPQVHFSKTCNREKAMVMENYSDVLSCFFPPCNYCMPPYPNFFHLLHMMWVCRSDEVSVRDTSCVKQLLKRNLELQLRCIFL